MYVASNPNPLSLATLAAADVYDIDGTRASIEFGVRHLLLSSVHGRLGLVTGHVMLDRKDLTSLRLIADVEVGGVTTSDMERDAYLKSEAFFDAATYPRIHFVSRRTYLRSRGRLTLEGDLTICGRTRPIALDVALSDERRAANGNIERSLLATARVDCEAFGLEWQRPIENGGLVFLDAVDVTLMLPLSRLTTSIRQAS